MRSQCRTAPRIGPWFHSLDNRGAIDWQGKIVGEPRPGVCLVQLFSWLDGRPTVQRLVPVVAMCGWSFYRTNVAMRAVGDRLVASWRT
jgi:hypothetical protein